MDLTEILKDVPKGTELYSTIHGIVEFKYIGSIGSGDYPIVYTTIEGEEEAITKEGKLYFDYEGECILFPSKENRDWNTFVAPIPDLPRFTPVFISERYDTKHPNMTLDLFLRYYDSKGKAYINGYKQGISTPFALIVPIDKYTHETNSFASKDNYGITSDKKW